MMRLTSKCRSRFGVTKIFYDALYLNDPSDSKVKMATASIHTPLADIHSSVYSPAQPKYQTTKLTSGVTVLTESISTPSNVQMGILVDAGSRDETPESSGAMHLLKHVYLKTAINTNETVNYGVVQMSGGEFEVDYNRQNIFYRVNCLSHDVIDVFSMLADCAFEPRNVVACSVGQHKLDDAHKLDAQTGGNGVFNDCIFTAAYGTGGLGNPLMGNRTNISNLIADTVQKFQLGNFTHDRVVISATGIENHQEFVDLVSQKMHFTQLGSTQPQRTSSAYRGGEVRNYNEGSNVHVAFAFEAPNYKNSLPLLIANQILGTGRSNGWIQRNMLDRNVFINDAQSFATSFSDSGLFGIKVAGSAAHVNDIVEAGAKTLSSVRGVSQSDVETAKAILKNRLGRHFTTNWKRLEEKAKSQYYTGTVNEDWESRIDSVTSSQVTDAVSKCLSTPLTLVAQGGQVNTIPSYDKVSQAFN